MKISPSPLSNLQSSISNGARLADAAHTAPVGVSAAFAHAALVILAAALTILAVLAILVAVLAAVFAGRGILAANAVIGHHRIGGSGHHRGGRRGGGHDGGSFYGGGSHRLVLFVSAASACANRCYQRQCQSHNGKSFHICLLYFCYGLIMRFAAGFNHPNFCYFPENRVFAVAFLAIMEYNSLKI